MDTSLVLTAAVVMIAIGVTFLYMLLGRRPGWVPRDAMEWIGSILSVALVISASALVVLALRSATTSPSAMPAMLVAPGAERPEILDMSLDAEAGDFPFRRLADGGQGSLDSLRGRVVLLNFWATWCAPCLSEIPELNRLQKDYAERGLVVLSVSDEDEETLSLFMDRFGMDTHSVRVPFGRPLPLPFTDAFLVRPTSYVVDRAGRVRRFLLGARSYEIFERVVTPYL